MRLSHVAHSNESRHTHQYAMSHIRMPQHPDTKATSSMRLQQVVSHTSTSHVTHINQSRHTHECVMLHIWMSPQPNSTATPNMRLQQVMLHISRSHVTRIYASCCTYEWLYHSRTTRPRKHEPATIHDAHIEKSWCTCQWVMSHTSVRHVAHMNESCHTHEMQDNTDTPACTCNKSFLNYQWVMLKTIHTWTYVNTHAYIERGPALNYRHHWCHPRTYIHMWFYIHMCRRTYTYRAKTCTCIHIYIHVHICIYTYVYPNTIYMEQIPASKRRHHWHHRNAYIHMYIYIHTSMDIHMHIVQNPMLIYTYIHTYT